LLSNLKQITPQRACTGASFSAGGIIPFDFDISPAERGKLNEGYLRVRASIQASIPATTADGVTNSTYAWGPPIKSFCNVPNFDNASPPALVGWTSIQGHDVGLAENWVSNMFPGVTFKMGGITVSDVQQFQPQIDMMVRRLTESYTSQKASKYADLMGMTLRERIDYISANAGIPSGTVYAANVPGASLAAYIASAQVQAASRPAYGSDGPCYIPSTSPFGSISFTGAGAAGIPTATKTTVESLWRPRSCGAFNTDQYLVAGKYRLELLPFTNWHINVLESVRNIPPANIFNVAQSGTPTGPNQFAVNIDDIQFFLPTCASPEYIDNTTFYISLEEYQVQGKQLLASGGASVNSPVYTIPWSTQTICMAVQTSSVSQQTICPPNKFLNIFQNNADATLSILDVNSDDLQSLQLQYSKTYPETNYTSALNYYNGKQNNYQRYYDDIQ
jgi:hypothetical protein